MTTTKTATAIVTASTAVVTAAGAEVATATDATNATATRVAMMRAAKAAETDGGVGRVVTEIAGGSDIEHKFTGEVTPLVKQRGLYKLKMWVPKDQSHLL